MPHKGEMERLQSTLEEAREENEHLRNGYASLAQRLIGLRMLQHVAQDLVSELDVDRLLRRILRSAINAVEGQAGALLLLDDSGANLVFAVVEGGGGEALVGQRMACDQGVAGWVVAHREPLIVPDVRQDDRHFTEIPDGVNFPVESLLCAPLAAKGKIIGALQVLNKTQSNRFDDDDLDILTSFAAQSAVAIENARLYQDLKRERDRIVAVEEDVRRRLARDLHDGPAQLLTAITLNIDFIEMLARRQPEKVIAELDSVRPIVQKAMRQVRTLLFDLRPVILETQGLVPALESYVERQYEMDELAYHLEVHDFAQRLAPPAEQAIFAIVQEATGNARKHARARNVWIGVAGQPARLVITVRDDGRGFDVGEVTTGYDQRGSLGMLNMQERAEGIGGKLTVRSRAGVGTTIVLTVPLEEVPAAPAEEA